MAFVLLLLQTTNLAVQRVLMQDSAQAVVPVWVLSVARSAAQTEVGVASAVPEQELRAELQVLGVEPRRFEQTIRVRVW